MVTTPPPPPPPEIAVKWFLDELIPNPALLYFQGSGGRGEVENIFLSKLLLGGGAYLGCCSRICHPF